MGERCYLQRGGVACFLHPSLKTACLHSYSEPSRVVQILLMVCVDTGQDLQKREIGQNQKLRAV
jgi:hypothetical protein